MNNSTEPVSPLLADKPKPCENWTLCPHVKSTGSDWNSDYYECKHCGITFRTNDEDMK